MEMISISKCCSLVFCVFSECVWDESCCLCVCPGTSAGSGGLVSRHPLLLQPCSGRSDDGASARQILDAVLHDAAEAGVQLWAQRRRSSRLQRANGARGEHQRRRLLRQHQQHQEQRPEHIPAADEGAGSKVMACGQQGQHQRDWYTNAALMQCYYHQLKPEKKHFKCYLK